MQRTPDDRFQRRAKDKRFEAEAMHDLKQRFLQNQVLPETLESHQPPPEVSELYVKQVVEEIQALRNPDVNQAGGVFERVTHEICKTVSHTAIVLPPMHFDAKSVYLQDPSTRFEPIGQELSNSSHAPLHSSITFSNNSTILQDVAQEFSLGPDQRHGFFIAGTKLISRLCVDTFRNLQHPLQFPANFVSENLRMILAGAAGTGKSQVVRALQKVAHRMGCPRAIHVISYVGVAAANLGGTTIHSTFGFSRDKSKVNERSETVYDRLKEARLLVVDEYSTCGKTTFARADCKLRACFQESEYFGGIDVLMIGDPLQFHPISDPALHSITNKNANHAAADAALAAFRTVIVLGQVFRSSENSDFTHCLLRLRDPSHFDDNEELAKSLEKINRRCLSKCPGLVQPSHPPLFVVPTSAERHAITLAARETLSQVKAIKIYEWTSASNKIWTKSDLELVDEYFWTTGSSLKVPPRFWAYIGMPVTVTLNPSYIHQQFGVATGAFGRIVYMHFATADDQPGGKANIIKTEPPEFILVQFETPTFYRIPGLSPGVLPICTVSASGRTSFKTEKLGSELSLPFSFNGFPLKHRFASTYQSMQCLTARNIIPELPKSMKGQNPKMLFMGLSRGTDWGDIRIMSNLSLEDLKRFRPSEEDVNVVTKLQTLDTNTRQSLPFV